MLGNLYCFKRAENNWKPQQRKLKEETLLSSDVKGHVGTTVSLTLPSCQKRAVKCIVGFALGCLVVFFLSLNDLFRF